MSLNGCVTMILAGGSGKRLGARYSSKPAVNFGGKYRIIDFTLQNCIESGIETIGILSQNHINDLGEYVKTAYGSKSGHGGFCMLPPQPGGM